MDDQEVKAERARLLKEIDGLIVKQPRADDETGAEPNQERSFWYHMFFIPIAFVFDFFKFVWYGYVLTILWSWFFEPFYGTLPWQVVIGVVMLAYLHSSLAQPVNLKNDKVEYTYSLMWKIGFGIAFKTGSVLLFAWILGNFYFW